MIQTSWIAMCTLGVGLPLITLTCEEVVGKFQRQIPVDAFRSILYRALP